MPRATSPGRRSSWTAAARSSDRRILPGSAQREGRELDRLARALADHVRAQVVLLVGGLERGQHLLAARLVELHVGAVRRDQTVAAPGALHGAAGRVLVRIRLHLVGA